MREIWCGRTWLAGTPSCCSSSAITIQVEPGGALPRHRHTLCNRFEVDDDGILTGGVVRPILWGPGKADAVQKFAADQRHRPGTELLLRRRQRGRRADVPRRQPAPHQSRRQDGRDREKRGWPILRFTSRGSDGLTATAAHAGRLRLLCPGPRAPSGCGPARPATGAAASTSSRRPGRGMLLVRQRCSSLNVIGEENLNNHARRCSSSTTATAFDPLITGALVRDNWTGVAQEGAGKRPDQRHAGQARGHRVHRPRRPRARRRNRCKRSKSWSRRDSRS